MHVKIEGNFLLGFFQDFQRNREIEWRVVRHRHGHEVRIVAGANNAGFADFCNFEVARKLRRHVDRKWGQPAIARHFGAIDMPYAPRLHMNLDLERLAGLQGMGCVNGHREDGRIRGESRFNPRMAKLRERGLLLREGRK